jgi:hypothetical protein
MDDQNKVPQTDVAGFLKVVDYLEQNGGSEDEIAYYCRQFIQTKWSVAPMPAPAVPTDPAAAATPSAPADTTTPTDPNAQPATPDAGTQPSA